MNVHILSVLADNFNDADFGDNVNKIIDIPCNASCDNKKDKTLIMTIDCSIALNAFINKMVTVAMTHTIISRTRFRKRKCT